VKKWFIDASAKRPRTVWRILAGYLLLFIVIAAVATPVDAIEIPWIESFAWQVIAAPILFVVSRLLARFVDRRRFGEYGLAWSRRGAGHLLSGIVVGAVLTSAIFVTAFAVGAVRILRFTHTIYDVPWIVTFLAFAARYASVAFFEELFHRGFLITNLADGLRSTLGVHTRTLALLASALLFGMLHFTNDNATALGALNLFLLGVLFGLPYVRTGSLYGSIGLHFAWNFVLGNVYGLPVSGYESRTALIRTETLDSVLWTGGAFGPEGSLIATAAVAVGILIMLRLTRHRETSLPKP
jgi:membrane protease YdiL (CAAX protease family)